MMKKFTICAAALLMLTAANAAPLATPLKNTNTPHMVAPVPVKPATAPVLTVTPQDLVNIGAICSAAMNSPQLDLNAKTQMGEYCVGVLNRIQTLISKK